MLNLFLALAFLNPAFATRHSPNLDQQRVALERIQTKFERFNETVSNIDAQFAEFRKAIRDGNRRQAQTLAEDIAKTISTSRRQFRDVENEFDESERWRLNFIPKKQIASWLDAGDDLFDYIAFRRNNRFNNGTPMDLLLASWRALHVGTKLKRPPSGLGRTGKIAGLDLRSTDGLIFLTVNGGMIRGRFEGMIGNSYVIRELLPMALAKRQQQEGWYRVLTLREVSRMEIIRKPPNVSQTLQPPAIISVDGTYSPNFVQKNNVTHIYLRRSDMELLSLVKNGRFDEAQNERVVKSEVALETTDRPDYTEIYFTDCSHILQ